MIRTLYALFWKHNGVVLYFSAARYAAQRKKAYIKSCIVLNIGPAICTLFLSDDVLDARQFDVLLYAGQISFEQLFSVALEAIFIEALELYSGDVVRF